MRAPLCFLSSSQHWKSLRFPHLPSPSLNHPLSGTNLPLESFYTPPSKQNQAATGQNRHSDPVISTQPPAMKSLAFMTALLGLLSLMMLASTTPLHTTDRDAPASLFPVASNDQLYPPVDKAQLSDPNVPPGPPDPPPPGPGLNVADYNLRNPNFRIPPFVLCPRDGNIFQDPAAGWPGGRQNPSYGGRALEPMFSATQVWDAFQVSTLASHKPGIHSRGKQVADPPLARLATSHACWPRRWLRP